MNKTITIVILAIIAFVALVWWGSSHQQPLKSSNIGGKSSLISSQIVYDFGTISMKNGDVSKNFIITNPTNKAIFISSIITSCMCTTAFIEEANGRSKGPFGMEGMGYVPPANETIKAGQSRTIRVVYNPNAHGPAGVGIINRFITITDASGSKLRLEIKAVVTP